MPKRTIRLAAAALLTIGLCAETALAQPAKCGKEWTVTHALRERIAPPPQRLDERALIAAHASLGRDVPGLVLLKRPPLSASAFGNMAEGTSHAGGSGILDQAWNAGLNSNVQAATTIRAQFSLPGTNVPFHIDSR